MKILLVLGKYLPEKSAGIENYSHFLAEKLARSGHSVKVCILKSNKKENYLYEGITITPLVGGFVSFQKLLQENEFDICHFQEYSAFGGIELFWFIEAKKFCGKIFFTFHLPYFTCYKNDFRYWGIDDCNTFSIPERCLKCVIATKLGYKKNTNLPLLNWVVEAIIPLVSKANKINSLQTRIEERAKVLSELLNTCTHVFIYANWFLKILNDNGYNNLSLKKIPYVTSSSLRPGKSIRTLIKKRLLFVGRIEKQKGLHLLCKAMNRISTEKIELDVYGNVVDDSYYKKCLNEFKFNFKETVPLKELLEILNNYDFLIMPSVFTEMYSMMIKDAFNFQLPVIASSAKGNVDAIHDGENGFLFNYDDYYDLARVIDKAYQMLENKWVPQFGLSNNYENDLKEILSYYN